MKQFTYTIVAEYGLHARPAGLLAKLAKEFHSDCTIAKGDVTQKLTSLLKVMTMGIVQGDTVTVTAEGADEDIAIVRLKAFFEENF